MMERYWGIVAKTNQTLNLTRITEPEEVAKKHFLANWSKRIIGKKTNLSG